jgi:hypothetical protein
MVSLKKLKLQRKNMKGGFKNSLLILIGILLLIVIILIIYHYFHNKPKNIERFDNTTDEVTVSESVLIPANGSGIITLLPKTKDYSNFAPGKFIIVHNNESKLLLKILSIDNNKLNVENSSPASLSINTGAKVKALSFKRRFPFKAKPP